LRIDYSCRFTTERTSGTELAYILFQVHDTGTPESLAFGTAVFIGKKYRWIDDSRVVNPHLFNAELDPAFFLTADPDPSPNPGV
jgi:hypothetical protein